MGVGANLVVTYLILLASVRFVGISSAELSAPDAFVAFAIAFWAGAVIPITGSGLGVVDGVLIAMLIELSGASDDALVAAALLWRVFYSLLTLPLGARSPSAATAPSPFRLQYTRDNLVGNRARLRSDGTLATPVLELIAQRAQDVSDDPARAEEQPSTSPTRHVAAAATCCARLTSRGSSGVTTGPNRPR